MRQAITVASVLLALGLAACEDALVVENLSDPDIERVFSTPQAVQQTIGSNFQACHNAVSNTNVAPQLAMLGLETYSQLNNFNMGARSTIPRSPVTNYRGAPTIFPDYSALARAARLGANALDALDKLIEEEKTLGSPAQNLRARSFAFFTIACNMGWLAMVYDSAGIVGPGMSSDSIPPLAGAADVAAAAIVTGRRGKDTIAASVRCRSPQRRVTVRQPTSLPPHRRPQVPGPRPRAPSRMPRAPSRRPRKTISARAASA